jgi:nanoRNase/pAp phosphatase (c-di-AMP/oligoRNAs hydrolase)
LRALAAIGNAKVGREYFAVVHEGIEKTKMYGRVVVTRLDELPYPDVVAQTADYFLKYKEAVYAFAIGRYRRNVLFSVRSDDPRARLGGVARSVVSGMGTAGGHGSAAGGQIPLGRKDRGSTERIQDTVIKRFLAALGMKPTRGHRLMPGR